MKPRVPKTPNLDQDETWQDEMELFLTAVERGFYKPAEELKFARKFTWEIWNDQRLPFGKTVIMTCSKNPEETCVHPKHMKLVNEHLLGTQVKS